jgi:hypothetical protein
MSVDLYVAIRANLAPNVGALRAAIAALGLSLTLPDDFDLAAARGFQPMTWNGEETGAELFPGTPDAFDAEDIWPGFANDAPGRDGFVQLTFGGDPMEGAAATAFALALVKAADGVLYDPQDGAVLDEAGARALIAAFLAG